MAQRAGGEVAATFTVDLSSEVLGDSNADKTKKTKTKAEDEAEEGLSRSLTLKQLLAWASAGDPATRRKVSAALADAGSDDGPRLHGWLHRKTELSPVDLKSVLRALGVAVPDSRGRFTNKARNPDEDWLEALVTMDRSSLSPALRRAHAECLVSVALLRALADSRHPDAAVSLVRFGYRHNGAFRDECGRQVRRMGVHAVPGLLRVRVLRDPLAFKMVRYAGYQLDRMNMTRPRLVARQADPTLLVVLLHAYGEVRDPAAVDTVLEHTDHKDPRVRRAARWAMLRYVSGRPPRAEKRKLKLAGGRTTERERSLYYTYRQLATRALAVALARSMTPGTGEPDEEKVSTLAKEVESRTLATRLYERQDARRREAQQQRLKKTLAMAKAGKLDQALRRFDVLLAERPLHPDRGTMAPFYFERGLKAYAAGELGRANTLFTKAIHLSPDGAHVNKARAYRLMAEAFQVERPGRLEEWKLREALRLQPGLDEARVALDAAAYRRRQQLFVAAGVGGGALLALLLGITLGWLRFCRR